GHCCATPLRTTRTVRRKNFTREGTDGDVLEAYRRCGRPPDVSTASSLTECSHPLADRRHVEIGHPQGRHRDPGEVVAELPGQGALRPADRGDPAQHADRAVVEPEVVHRAGVLAALDLVVP